VRKLNFTPRSLKFLEFTSQPLAPPLSSSSASPLPRRSAAAGRCAALPEVTSCSSTAPRVTPELAHRFASFPLAFPEHATLLYRPPELPLCRRRPLPLTVTAALLWQLPHAAPRMAAALVSFLWPSPTRSTLPPPLPELCTADTTRRRSTAAAPACRASS
jgi:hypothetical protein